MSAKKHIAVTFYETVKVSKTIKVPDDEVGAGKDEEAIVKLARTQLNIPGSIVELIERELDMEDWEIVSHETCLNGETRVVYPTYPFTVVVTHPEFSTNGFSASYHVEATCRIEAENQAKQMAHDGASAAGKYYEDDFSIAAVFEGHHVPLDHTRKGE